MPFAVGASWNNKRLNFVALAFQRKTDTLEFHSVVKRQDSRNVFKQEPSRMYALNNGSNLRPDCAVILLAISSSGNAVWLAREPCCK
jgi:hypothetical protein